MVIPGEPLPAQGRGFFGRTAELAVLADLFEAAGADVVAVVGLPGVGKSALLRAFAREALRRGQQVRVLDCRTIEPTPRSFERAIQAAGIDLSAGQVLCLDHYEHFLLLDAWLRGRLQAGVDAGFRLVLAGRGAPAVAWSTTGLRMRTLRLDVLDEAASRALLADVGIEAERAARIHRFAKGHPLALELALAGSEEVGGPGRDLEGLASPELVHRLTHYFLEHVEDPETREALEAASTVRRVTKPILDEMLAGPTSPGLYDRLASLPLVEVRSDGLSLHPTVHETVASWLRSADPSRFTTYRRRAWQALERDSRNIGARDLWRYTADVIYLIDDPVVRDAFFPSTSQRHGVEPLGPDDEGAVLDITAIHDGPAGRDEMARWLLAHPRGFHVVRDGDGVVQGFYLLLDPATAPAARLAEDPVTAAWLVDLPNELRDEPERVLFLRRWLSRTAGDAPSPEQGVSWLDVKRAYLEGRPRLRRVYICMSDLAPYASAATKLGFVPVCPDLEAPVVSALLAFGSGSVDAWLGRLVRGSLGLRAGATLDPEQHALTVGGTSIPLTPRELAVMRVLLDAEGAVVGHDALLDEAWAGGHAVGSNVVAVLVRGLRKKLGEAAERLETVRGVGYRWRG